MPTFLIDGCYTIVYEMVKRKLMEKYKAYKTWLTWPWSGNKAPFTSLDHTMPY